MNINELLKKSILAGNAGDIEKSNQILKKILRKYPLNYDANHNLCVNYFKMGNFKDLIPCAKKALTLNVNDQILQIYINVLIKTQDTFDNSINFLEGLLQNSNESKKISLLSALIALTRYSNDDAKSIELYEKLISFKKQDINLYISLGYLLNKNNQLEEAVSCYIKALEINENDFNALNNLGITYNNMNQAKSAELYLSKALEINDKEDKLLLTLAAVKIKLRKIDEAINLIELARKIDPNNPIVDFQMGTMLFSTGKDDNDAIKYLNRVIEKQPNHVEANFHLGLCYLRMKDYQSASKYYSFRTLQDDKQQVFNDFEHTQKIDKLKIDDSNVIIFSEQGIGDQILYSRLLNIIAKKVKSLTYVASEKTINFFKQVLDTKIKVIDLNEYKNFYEEYKSSIKLNLASLMFLFKDPTKEVMKLPIYSANEKNSKYLKEKYHKNKDELLVGISWKSKNKVIGDEKSFSLRELSAFANNKKIKFVSLQYGEIAEDLNELDDVLNRKILVTDVDCFNDIDRLASLISICDCVITCSNVTTHIAGSIGKKTFLAVPKDFGRIWYWNDERFSSWYPSVEIFRQKKDKEWGECFLKIRKRVESLRN